MKRAAHAILSVLVFMVLSASPVGTHAVAATPMDMQHSMGASSMSSGTPGCLSLCIAATIRKEDLFENVQKDVDDEPQPAYYAQFQTSTLETLDMTHSLEAKLAIESTIPPDKVPTYIKLSVFRA